MKYLFRKSCRLGLPFALIVLASSLCPSQSLCSEIPTHLRGDGTVTIHRPITGERATFRYRDEKGDYDDHAFDEIAHLFRCRLTSEEHPIDPQLIEILDSIEDHFSADEVRLISAFRSQERNAMMRKKGRRVAKGSLHMEGRAADIEVPGVSKIALRNFAHSLGQGGVGYYSKRSFVHVDSGEVRAWGFGPAKAGRRTRPAAAHK
ncbi:MAG: YcbK family protein [Proteobacteria bacterium]|nr:YcbK family protein [Pseudomonadota bacterium]